MRGAVLRISAIVEALVEAGATPEMILSAVCVAEAHALDALERRRASDRVRQQRRRQRLAREEMEGREGEGLACPRHATAGDSHVTARDFPLPNKERSPAPPKEINPTPNPIDAGSVVARVFPAGPREGTSRQAEHPGAEHRDRQGHPGVGHGHTACSEQPDPEHRCAGRRKPGEAAHRGGESPKRAQARAKDREAGHRPVNRGDANRGERKRRATRLPDAFVPDWEFAAGKGFSRAAAEAEFEKFGDYWRAKAGREATKLDWQATWRNWIRNAGRPRAFGGLAPPGSGKGNFRAHQDEVQRELDRALGRAGDDDFTGTTFELE
ncbi:hypothetical protein I6F26_14230 [Ensifer sp. IC3342]|nr:hypothetical protein [Ensifer sp. BRP08]MCA1447736.1 hypothetical protein [Ensifer sp. IC3342]